MSKRAKILVGVIVGVLFIALVALIVWALLPGPAISVTIEPRSGQPGALVKVMGERFPANKEIYVGLALPGMTPTAGTSFGSAVSDRDGKFTAAFPYPVDPTWTKPTEVTVFAGTPGGDAVATARVLLYSIAWLLTPSSVTATGSPTATVPAATAGPGPTITLMPTSGITGSTILVTGSGWRANELLVLSLSGFGAQIDGTTDTNAQGNFGKSIVLPANWGASTATVSARSLDGTRQATATFGVLLATPVYNLTVFKPGAGTGTVSSIPSGIDCGLTCSASFNQSALVTLGAKPDAGFVFAGWSGDTCRGLGGCVVTMNGNKMITATFALKAATLTLGNLNQTFDGTPKAATVTTSPPGLSDVSIRYSQNGQPVTAPRNAGTYDVQATLTSPNYAAAPANGKLVIARATPIVLVTGGAFLYDGQEHPATAANTGVAGAVVSGTYAVSYTPGGANKPVNPGTYQVAVTFISLDSNYANATGSSSITINNAFTLTKTSAQNFSAPPKAGDTIFYTLAATNTVNMTLNKVSISDPKLDVQYCNQPTSLGPNDTLTCSGAYALKQDDLDAGKVSNTATVTGSTPPGQLVWTTKSVSVMLTQVPTLSLTIKQPPEFTWPPKEGDTINYDDLVATNVGNVTLNNVLIKGTKLGTPECKDQPTRLGPTDTRKCTSRYTLTKADLEAHVVTNTVTVTGWWGPQNRQVSDTRVVIVTVP